LARNPLLLILTQDSTSNVIYRFRKELLLISYCGFSIENMWKPYCNKPSAAILEKMNVFENCEDRKATHRGKKDSLNLNFMKSLSSMGRISKSRRAVSCQLLRHSLNIY
ncbi:hypothetical protein C0J52_00518, partial [Blattella germanica]